MTSARHVLGWPVRRLAAAAGFDLVPRVRPEVLPPDFDDATIALIAEVRPFTLTTPERIAALREAVRYIVQAQIPGAFLECGVWRGGSMMAVAKTLLELGVDDRDLYLFDTFTTMPPPGDEDVDLVGNRMADHYEAAIAAPAFAYPSEDGVRDLVAATGYPAARLHLVKGMVEDTIPDHAPDQLALCRLDTDWYVSTLHEMRHLFPRIADGGVLLVDDYGHFMGCKQAVDEYLDDSEVRVLLNRIDFSGRIAIVNRAVVHGPGSDKPRSAGEPAIMQRYSSTDE